MIKEFILTLIVLVGLLSGLSSSIPICMTWSQTNGNLQFVCQVNELHLPLTLIDPSNKELALCYPQFNQGKCFKHEPGVNITQNLSTNETVFSVDKNVYSNINGNWTCQHGTYGYSAYVTVSTCNTCDTVQKSSLLNAPIWTLAGVGIASWVMCAVITVMSYIGKQWWLNLIERCRTSRFFNSEEKCFTYFVYITMHIACIVFFATLSNIDFEDSTLQQAFLILVGMGSTILVFLMSVKITGFRHSNETKEVEMTSFEDRQSESVCSQKDKPVSGKI